MRGDTRLFYWLYSAVARMHFGHVWKDTFYDVVTLFVVIGGLTKAALFASFDSISVIEAYA